MTGEKLSQFIRGISDQQKIQFIARYIEEGKDPAKGLDFSIGLGVLGFDRFYIAHIGWGILKLLTIGGLYMRKKVENIAKEIGYYP